MRTQLADQTQTKILETLGSMDTTLDGIYQRTDLYHDKPSAGPTLNKPQTEPCFVAPGSHKKPKARQIRRKADAARRRAFGSSRSH